LDGSRLLQQQPEAFLNAPGGADLLRWVMLVEHPAEPDPLLGGQVVGAGEQQSAVDPHRVGGGAAPAQLVVGDALPYFADHLVGQRDQVPAIDRDQRVWQGSADAGGIGR
jgi:hypothetical protein